MLSVFGVTLTSFYTDLYSYLSLFCNKMSFESSLKEKRIVLAHDFGVQDHGKEGVVGSESACRCG